MTDRQILLHIGAGKCGSSALQTALSRQPLLAAADGTRFRYLTLGGGVNPHRLVGGARLQRLAALSPYGYAAFHAVPQQPEGAATYRTALRAAWARGQREGHVPILSNEGWIGQAPFFADVLAGMGHPPVEALAFLRAPVDWLNAAYWQWGVWSHPRFEAWYGGPRNPYGLIEQLAAWAAIPNLRLSVFPGRSDVVAALAGHLGVPLGGPPGVTSGVNRSSAPALIGFFLRNRRFRPSPHSPQAEFVVQRWCPLAQPRRPWAVRAPDVHALRPLAAQTLDRLHRLLPAETRARLFAADPRWQAERPYHAEILQGPTPLHRLDDLPLLHDSLAQGVAAAAAAAGVAAPALPCPAPGADHAAWDASLSLAMEHLLLLDDAARTRADRHRPRGGPDSSPDAA